MQIILNGRPATVSDEATLAHLLVEMGLGDAVVAIERNGEVVPRAEHGIVRPQSGDRIEIVEFVGGG